LSRGDRLILYTDGFTESTNEDGEMFGEERLQDILQGCLDMSLSATKENLRDRFEKFKGIKNAEDDVSLLLIEF
ncbi:MAG TPA: SpoIIE family protein phosphatase, partial [Mesotoga sp.]|nr:SpoIIE family protein phosphatase [Mesotoga sp.]